MAQIITLPQGAAVPGPRVSSVWDRYRDWRVRRAIGRELRYQPDSVLADAGLARREVSAWAVEPIWGVAFPR